MRMRSVFALVLVATTYAVSGWLGSAQAASTTLVIAEFRTRGPSGGNDEFIEIRNVSGGAISLSGWSVIGSNGSGLTETRANLANVTLGPGCAWLLGNSNTNGYTGPVDQTYAVGITDDGGIQLIGPGGIADQVGLSAGSAFGEGARLPNFGSSNGNRSYERTMDTDNNAGDFRLLSPSAPQTSGAGCNVQPTPTNPTVTGGASPNPVNAGSNTLLTATVVAGTNPASTGLAVTVTTDAIGVAGTTPLLDNGTNGDATAGDNVFSRSVTIAAGTAAGAKSLPLTVTDTQGRSGGGSISLTVQVQTQPATPPTVTAAFVTPNPLQRYSGAKVVVSVTPGANPVSTGLQVTMNLAALGGSAVTALSDAGGGGCDVAAGDRSFAACFFVPGTVSSGLLTLTGQVRDAQGRTAPVSISTSVAADTDTDTDALPDQCETTFGLSTSSGTGENGPTGDPDGDQRSNALECAAGTHPRGTFRRYLAEGVTNAFFQTRIALFNPSTTATTALVRLQPEGSPERSLLVTVPGQQRRTLLPEDTATITDAPFATVVESDVELVVDRLMTWGVGAYGSHAETAVHAPSTTWYLAEGATGWRFSLFYLLQNPSETDAAVEVSYLRGSSDPVLTRTYTVGARQRRTIWVDEEQFPEGSGLKPLEATDVSASIRSVNDVPIIVERSMYMSPDDQVFGAGHAAAGVTSPSTHWFFAEGATGTFFDEYILLANPGNALASVTITYSPEGRAPITHSYDVAPQSRRTIWVDQEPGSRVRRFPQRWRRRRRSSRSARCGGLAPASHGGRLT